MRPIEHLVIHCSDSDGGRAEAIAQSRPDLGPAPYHWVIENARRIVFRDGLPVVVADDTERDGLAVRLRADSSPGTHAVGLNATSIGICLVGRGAFTRAQHAALLSLILWYSTRYAIPVERVIGHYETPDQQAKAAAGVAKSCPRINMAALRGELIQLEVSFALALRGAQRAERGAP